MSATPPLLRAHGLGKRYGGRVALEDFDLDLAPGEIVGLLGPNGAGKTTAFALLAGLVRADTGTFALDGRAIDPSDAEWRRRLGVAFQHPSIDIKLTGRENLALGAALHGLGGGEARRRVAAALAFADLGDRAGEPAARYSGGMRRKLELARALMHEPEILLMDEPGQGVDPAALGHIWGGVDERRRQRGLCVLVTTHLAPEAERCDRLVFVDRGSVRATGTPDALRARVAGDVIRVRGRDPGAIATAVRQRLGLEATLIDGAVVFESGAGGGTARGHELVPRIAELFPAGALDSIAVDRPSLGDVFAKLTGHGLHADADGPAEAAAR